MSETKKTTLNCFKEYDVRGKLGSEFNESIAYRIGRSVSEHLMVETVVIGYDARATSKSIADAVSQSVQDTGANCYSIGLCGTEEVYWAVANYGFSAGIVITASHNPIDFNGMKIVKKGSKPLEKSEFLAIKVLAENQNFRHRATQGNFFNIASSARTAYIKKILSFVNLKSLRPIKIVINSGNGAAGPTLKSLISLLEQSRVKSNIVLVNEMPDPTFPYGIPNPLLLENQKATGEIVKRLKADFGIAFDGDFDRCFFFNGHGEFIQGEYIVGILAECFLRYHEGSSIVYDPRVVWNVIDQIEAAGGNPVLSRTGHTYIKQAMRQSNAIYGGEMSAHHYFRDFAYCDSGMVPWLLIWELISTGRKSLKEIVDARSQNFISSGEINFKINNPNNCLAFAKEKYGEIALSIDEVDGISVDLKNWRFNLRKSNTEALIRINVETIKDPVFLKEKTHEITEFVQRFNY
tara:strand:- start:41 stop:1432 length:1392 start_codon:yes stop_codon:yes gene_type:complete